MVFALLLASALSAGAAEIRVLTQARVRGSFVRLGDVAEIRGDKSEAARLQRIELAAAPADGKSREMTRNEIRELLGLRGVDLLRHRMGGAARVRITTLHRVAPVADQGARRLPTAPRPIKTAVVVANRSIARGERIGESDVRLESVQGKVNAGGVQRVEDVVGKEAIRAIRGGHRLRPQDIRRPRVVRRGENVILTVRAGSVRIQTQGKALADGSVDDVILVELGDGKRKSKRLSARVSGVQRVEILAPTQPPSRVAERERDSRRRLAERSRRYVR